MGVLPADPFLYVWNATVMSLGIDNVSFFLSILFLFLAVDSSIRMEHFSMYCGTDQNSRSVLRHVLDGNVLSVGARALL